MIILRKNVEKNLDVKVKALISVLEDLKKMVLDKEFEKVSHLKHAILSIFEVYQEELNLEMKVYKLVEKALNIEDIELSIQSIEEALKHLINHDERYPLI